MDRRRCLHRALAGRRRRDELPGRADALPPKPGRPVAAQERELRADAAEIAATRIGADGEPELLLHDDLGGYSWNVPKGAWLNVGTGTAAAKPVRSAWAAAQDFFLDNGHLPETARESLQRMEGHSYHLFDPAHLATRHRDGAFLVGDALGLAHPITAEGILPAALSGRLCAEAILDGAPATTARASLHTHAPRLRAHPRPLAALLALRREPRAPHAGRRAGGAGRGRDRARLRLDVLRAPDPWRPSLRARPRACGGGQVTAS